MAVFTWEEPADIETAKRERALNAKLRDKARRREREHKYAVFAGAFIGLAGDDDRADGFPLHP